MHVLISSDLPSTAFTIKLGSARKGRAILIRSAEPDARMSSAVSGALILNGFKGRLGLVWEENGPQYIKVITTYQFCHDRIDHERYDTTSKSGNDFELKMIIRHNISGVDTC